jgi:hypothetical protein
MPSLIYNSFVEDLSRGAVDMDTDTFWMMLTASGYAENKDTHGRRSDVTNEVFGTGYTAGGQAVACTVNRDNATDRVTYTFAATAWGTATITARKAVVYKRRGGLASADELVFVNDFGSDVSSTADTFTVAASTITLQN